MTLPPRIAITPGEPAGIGPDIVLAIAQQGWDAELVAICDPELLRERAALLGIDITLETADLGREARAHVPGKLKVYPIPLTVPCMPGQLEKFEAAYDAAGKKLDMGKACVRVKTSEDVLASAVAETIASVPVADYVKASAR